VTRDASIDAYIDRAEAFAQPILTHVRERVHAALRNVEETVKWGMPAYTVDGKIVLITAAFKAHAALNFWRGQELGSSHASVGAMGQFGRLTSVGDLPEDGELDRLIREAAELTKSAPAARKAKHAPKPPPQLHPEFAAALAKAPEAKAALDSFAPSAQRDYFEWIAEAKQDATRQKRIASAIEWLSEGKRRNWKYEKC
jgi:uncharacterized protein YdeI (YjbR/CyaY-like superfamily)